jgi:hypothetical protein
MAQVYRGVTDSLIAPAARCAGATMPWYPVHRRAHWRQHEHQARDQRTGDREIAMTALKFVHRESRSAVPHRQSDSSQHLI